MDVENTKLTRRQLLLDTALGLSALVLPGCSHRPFLARDRQAPLTPSLASLVQEIEGRTPLRVSAALEPVAEGPTCIYVQDYNHFVKEVQQSYADAIRQVHSFFHFDAIGVERPPPPSPKKQELFNIAYGVVFTPDRRLNSAEEGRFLELTSGTWSCERFGTDLFALENAETKFLYLETDFSLDLQISICRRVRESLWELYDAAAKEERVVLRTPRGYTAAGFHILRGSEFLHEGYDECPVISFAEIPPDKNGDVVVTKKNSKSIQRQHEALDRWYSKHAIDERNRRVAARFKEEVSEGKTRFGLLYGAGHGARSWDGATTTIQRELIKVPMNVILASHVRDWRTFRRCPL